MTSVTRPDSPSTPDKLKFQAEHFEEKGSSLETPTYEEDPRLVKKIIRKVDLRLLPILGAMYALSLIDRTNLANARINGGGEEIGLSHGEHYSIATLVFFPPYILLEIPSNVVFRKFGAARFLGLIGVLWGGVMVAMGFVNTWYQMTICRAFLGALEAGFFPACVWLISCWYKRSEVQVRMAAFYLGSVFIGAFSSILAWGLAQIKHDTISGWRWILIIEGLATVALAVLGYFVIVDFPDKNKFLTKEETAIVKDRVERDRGDTAFDPLTIKKTLKYFMDSKLWSFGLCFGCATSASYAYGYFTPIILAQIYNGDVKKAQLMVAPTGVVACIVAFGLAKVADRYRLRAPIVIVQAIITIVGLSMTAFHPSNGVRLAGVFIGYTGAQGNVPAVLAYQSNNIRGQSKRAYASALQVGFGGVGGIIASVAFRQQDYPFYKLGTYIVIALQVLIIVLCLSKTAWFMYCNREAKAGRRINEGLEGFYYTI